VTFQVGGQVFVPTSLVGRTNDRVALARFEIAEMGDVNHPRSLKMLLSDDEDPENGWVVSSRVHQRVWLSAVRIGDLNSEMVLLDQLAKSLHHFLQLLVGSDYFDLSCLRTRSEFAQFWSQVGSHTSHLIAKPGALVHDSSEWENGSPKWTVELGKSKDKGRAAIGVRPLFFLNWV
jgi:hypothetical protein